MNTKGSIPMPARIAGIMLLIAACTAVMLGRASQVPEPQRSPGPRGDLRLILGEQQLGSKEISIAERLWPANYDSGEHSHTTIEVIYVLSGEYRHVLNGQSQVLSPGMVGFAKPGDKVRHTTGPKGPAKALLITVPGDEGLVERFRQRAR